MTARTVRVAIVLAADGSACHPRIDDCGFDVVAELRAIPDLLRAPSHEHEVAIVGCTPTQLADPRFHSQLARLSRAVPTVIVTPHLTPAAAAVAARSRVKGLASRDSRPEDLARTVRTVVRGRIAYPPEALDVVLRLLPPLVPRRTLEPASSHT